MIRLFSVLCQGHICAIFAPAPYHCEGESRKLCSRLDIIACTLCLALTCSASNYKPVWVCLRRPSKLETGGESAPRSRGGTLVVESPMVLMSEAQATGAGPQSGRWTTTGSMASSSSTSRNNNQPAGYNRMQRTVHVSRARRSGVIVGARPVVPASVVPEDLINQCQVVLQGKSRNLIIRELQRTNLDVNMAVNNLLSRDDEGEGEDEDSQDYSVPDDLISLLDSGMHDHPSVIIDADAMFGEDMFGYSSLRSRSVTRSRLDRDRELERDREIFRIRDRRRLETFREDHKSLEREKSDSLSSDGSKKTGQQSQNPIVLGEEMEFWMEKDGETSRFTHVGAMHSELVAVGTNGQLYSWKWTDPEPFKSPEVSSFLTPLLWFGFSFDRYNPTCNDKNTVGNFVITPRGLGGRIYPMLPNMS
ncbi:E3 ubiquitin-protein ligase UBR5-like isoform X2 [Littorina saxatilis]|uniref:E3 ubiquitin-protein ligase UBR5-like isoform X2 n=1 Tax=Littorina saxatilis TaxID=31220 RepID=UPI0038B5D001